MKNGIETIRKYFTVETAPRQPGKWLITCEKCGDRWHLTKTSSQIGNVLHLLMHARGHDHVVRQKKSAAGL